jgi:predicted Zn-dependent protease
MPLRLLLGVFALSGLVACTAVKTTSSGSIGLDRTQLMSPFVSEQQLAAGANQAYVTVLREQQAKGALNTDLALTKRVRGIASRIIPQVGAFRSDAKGWNWQVNVIESDQLNAWAMPGGKIAFYSGIINKLKLTDSEIAAIMGHEIAHALREHSRERASEAATLQLLVGVGGTLAGVGGNTQAMAQMAYNATFAMKNSRTHETEADRIGVELMARAGYDPRAAINVWRKMGAASGARSQPEFLSTHPSPETRIADLTRYSALVMPLYQRAPKAPT